MKKTKTKTRPKRATSDRVSRIAARVMSRWCKNDEWERKRGLARWARRKKSDWSELTWGDALALAASCLNQDETRGRSKTRR